MAVLQNNFGEDIPIGFPGMEADGELSNIITRTLEGSTPCVFGRAVFQGTADRGVTLTVSSDLMGFALSSIGLPVLATRAADTYAPKDNVRIKNRGKLWVQSSTAANKRQPVFLTSAGAITNVSTANTEAEGWEFDDTISAAGLVRIVRR